jgi:hypothetical protein
MRLCLGVARCVNCLFVCEILSVQLVKRRAFAWIGFRETNANKHIRVYCDLESVSVDPPKVIAKYGFKSLHLVASVL